MKERMGRKEVIRNMPTHPQEEESQTQQLPDEGTAGLALGMNMG